MNAKQLDGCTLRQNLEVIQRQGIVVPELDNEPELPRVFEEVWYWFLKLNTKRTSGAIQPNSISYQEMKSYFDLQGYSPEEWEIEAIDLLDEIVLQEYSKQFEKEQKRNNNKNK